MNQAHQQPSAEQFIDFQLSGGSASPVYQWLRLQPSFLAAQRRLVHQRDALQFAMRVSGCFGRFIAGQKMSEASTKKRAAAARGYAAALKWCRSGFGPYAKDDQGKLIELLTTARDYMLGQHLAPGFQTKGGAHRSVGLLIRELVVFLYIFNFPSRALNSVITDLVSIVSTVDAKTVERNVKAYKNQSKATDR